MANDTLDKYARDAEPWRFSAEINYAASKTLFESDNLYMYFPATVLGHHALEMYLKAALIRSGMTACNPRKIKFLALSIGITKQDCAWGHDLIALAEELARRRPDFNTSAELDITIDIFRQRPNNTIRFALEHFNPFHSELRYPHELDSIAGLGQHEGAILDHLWFALKPFAEDPNYFSEECNYLLEESSAER